MRSIERFNNLKKVANTIKDIFKKDLSISSHVEDGYIKINFRFLGLEDVRESSRFEYYGVVSSLLKIIITDMRETILIKAYEKLLSDLENLKSSAEQEARQFLEKNK